MCLCVVPIKVHNCSPRADCRNYSGCISRWILRVLRHTYPRTRVIECRKCRKTGKRSRVSVSENSAITRLTSRDRQPSIPNKSPASRTRATESLFCRFGVSTLYPLNRKPSRTGVIAGVCSADNTRRLSPFFRVSNMFTMPGVLADVEPFG